MTKINIPFDCGNSPKKEFLKKFNIAFVKGNADFIIEHVSKDIVWTIHGDKRIEGKEAFVNGIQKMKECIAEKLSLHNIITHGKEASANGEMILNGKTYAFCDVYHFKNSRSRIIKKMESYVISV